MFLFLAPSAAFALPAKEVWIYLDRSSLMFESAVDNKVTPSEAIVSMLNALLDYQFSASQLLFGPQDNIVISTFSRETAQVARGTGADLATIKQTLAEYPDRTEPLFAENQVGADSVTNFDNLFEAIATDLATNIPPGGDVTPRILIIASDFVPSPTVPVTDMCAELQLDPNSRFKADAAPKVRDGLRRQWEQLDRLASLIGKDSLTVPVLLSIDVPVTVSPENQNCANQLILWTATENGLVGRLKSQVGAEVVAFEQFSSDAQTMSRAADRLAARILGQLAKPSLSITSLVPSASGLALEAEVVGQTDVDFQITNATVTLPGGRVEDVQTGSAVQTPNGPRYVLTSELAAPIEGEATVTVNWQWTDRVDLPTVPLRVSRALPEAEDITEFSLRDLRYSVLDGTYAFTVGVPNAALQGVRDIEILRPNGRPFVEKALNGDDEATVFVPRTDARLLFDEEAPAIYLRPIREGKGASSGVLFTELPRAELDLRPRQSALALKLDDQEQAIALEFQVEANGEPGPVWNAIQTFVIVTPSNECIPAPVIGEALFHPGQSGEVSLEVPYDLIQSDFRDQETLTIHAVMQGASASSCTEVRNGEPYTFALSTDALPPQITSASIHDYPARKLDISLARRLVDTRIDGFALFTGPGQVSGPPVIANCPAEIPALSEAVPNDFLVRECEIPTEIWETWENNGEAYFVPIPAGGRYPDSFDTATGEELPILGFKVGLTIDSREYYPEEDNNFLVPIKISAISDPRKLNQPQPLLFEFYSPETGQRIPAEPAQGDVALCRDEAEVFFQYVQDRQGGCTAGAPIGEMDRQIDLKLTEKLEKGTKYEDLQLLVRLADKPSAAPIAEPALVCDTPDGCQTWAKMGIAHYYFVLIAIIGGVGVMSLTHWRGITFEIRQPLRQAKELWDDAAPLSKLLVGSAPASVTLSALQEMFPNVPGGSKVWFWMFATLGTILAVSLSAFYCRQHVRYVDSSFDRLVERHGFVMWTDAKRLNTRWAIALAIVPAVLLSILLVTFSPRFAFTQNLWNVFTAAFGF